MKYCEYCGYQLEDDDQFCTNCGRTQNDMSYRGGSQGGSSKTVIIIIVAVVGAIILGLVAWLLISNLSGSDDEYAATDSSHYSQDSTTANSESSYTSDSYTTSNDYGGYSGGGYSGCIFPYSSEEYLEEYEVTRLSTHDLQYAINELYARHGKIFSDQDVRSHFNSCDWYTPVSKDIDTSYFNAYEKYNWQMLTKERDSRK